MAQMAVILAKAGVCPSRRHSPLQMLGRIPACAGMTVERGRLPDYAAAVFTASTMSPTTVLTNLLVVAFRHDADHRLGAGRADDQAAACSPSLALAPSMHLDDALVVERLAAADSARSAASAAPARNALQISRHRLAGRDDARQHLQRRDQAVAGRREIRQHDVAGLLAADVEAVLAHVLDDVAVADLRARQRQPDRSSR